MVRRAFLKSATGVAALGVFLILDEGKALAMIGKLETKKGRKWRFDARLKQGAMAGQTITMTSGISPDMVFIDGVLQSEGDDRLDAMYSPVEKDGMTLLRFRRDLRAGQMLTVVDLSLRL